MIKALLTASAISLGTMFLALPVQAIGLTFNWSFVASSTLPGPVTGTITGLQIGNNNGSGITATVTGTPTGAFVGTVFDTFRFTSSGGGNAFTVDAGGNVTFADALYTNVSGDSLTFGGGFGPQLIKSNFSAVFTDFAGQTAFTTAATAVPFEFAPNGAVVLLGGLWGAKKLRKKLSKKDSQ